MNIDFRDKGIDVNQVGNECFLNLLVILTLMNPENEKVEKSLLKRSLFRLTLKLKDLPDGLNLV